MQEEGENKGKAKTRWNNKEIFRHFYFLILKNDDIVPRRKSAELFVSMSVFVGSRCNKQCRSHHQKAVKPLVDQFDFIYYFYNRNYKQRMLGEEHLKKEVRHCLNQMKQEGERITVVEKRRRFIGQLIEYDAKIDQIVSKIRFEEKGPIRLIKDHQGEDQINQEGDQIQEELPEGEMMRMQMPMQENNQGDIQKQLTVAKTQTNIFDVFAEDALMDKRDSSQIGQKNKQQEQ